MVRFAANGEIIVGVSKSPTSLRGVPSWQKTNPKHELIEILNRPTLLFVAQELEADVHSRDRVDTIRTALRRKRSVTFSDILYMLNVKELQHVCDFLELPRTGRRDDLLDRLESLPDSEWSVWREGSSPPPKAPQKPKGDKPLLDGRYQLIRKIGKGGFGIAWEAIDRKSRGGEKVVVKLAHGPDEGESVLREMDRATRLSHPNICRCFSAGRTKEQYFLVSEHGGESVEHRIGDVGAIPIASAISIAEQAAQGLDYAHEHKVLHLDVNPGNILVDAGGRARVC